MHKEGWEVIKRLSVYSFLFLVLSCSSLPTDPGGVLDPTFNWDPVTTNCLDQPLTNVQYNLYIIPGPGPVPTITITDIPCGDTILVDNTQHQPVNPTPITGTTFQIDLPPGQYTGVVEAVVNGTVRGGFTSVTFQVIERPQGTLNLQVGP